MVVLAITPRRAHQVTNTCPFKRAFRPARPAVRRKRPTRRRSRDHDAALMRTIPQIFAIPKARHRGDARQAKCRAKPTDPPSADSLLNQRRRALSRGRRCPFGADAPAPDGCPAPHFPRCLQEDVAMRNFDFSPLTRSTVGFDRVFDLLDSAFTAAQVDEGYPPFNIVKTGDTSYRIELAVAGFGPGDLSIVAQENVLTISGSK